MDVLDRLRLGQGQEVVVALQMALAGVKPLAAKMPLVEAQALDLRAHRAVEDENPLVRRAVKGRQRVLLARERRLSCRIERALHFAYRSCRFRVT